MGGLLHTLASAWTSCVVIDTLASLENNPFDSLHSRSTISAAFYPKCTLARTCSVQMVTYDGDELREDFVPMRSGILTTTLASDGPTVVSPKKAREDRVCPDVPAGPCSCSWTTRAHTGWLATDTGAARAGSRRAKVR